ncbi:MAG: methyltransferase domain-containing protein [Actinomycetota bacterium]
MSADPGAYVLRQWERAAAVYDRVIGTALGDAHRAILTRAGDVAGRDVLDVGCGTGRVATLAARRGARVTGVDLSPAMLAVARGVPDLAGACLEVMDAQDLRLPDGAFDATVASFSLMFCPDPGRAAAEVRRVLRPGGVLAAAVWCRPEECEHHDVAAAALDAAGAPDLPGVPGGDALCDPDRLHGLLRDAGFAEIRIDKRRFALRFPGPHALWDAVALLYAERLPAEGIAAAREAALAVIARVGLPLRSNAWVVTAR